MNKLRYTLIVAVLSFYAGGASHSFATCQPCQKQGKPEETAVCKEPSMNEPANRAANKGCAVDSLRIVGDTKQPLLELSCHDRSCNCIPYAEITEKFNALGAWGMETTLDITNCDPEAIRDGAAIERYVHELCDLIEMKRFGDTVVVHFGEDESVAGYSMTQLIETSLISGHFANATNTIYINVFSCKLYDPYVVAEFTKEFFGGENCTMNVLLRK